MEFKLLRRIANSVTPYTIALVIASGLLLLITGISYLQIKNLQTSSEWVSHSLKVDKEINRLFSQYSLMESAEFRAVILRDSTFADSYIDYKLESDIALQNLTELTKDIPEHRVSLDSVKILKDKLHNTLISLHGKIGSPVYDSIVSTNVKTTAELLKKLRGIKTKMLLKKDALLQERLSAYKKNTILTPISSLLLAVFSLGIFAVAYLKIRRDKNRIISSEALLQNIVQSTDNIMNYYEPLYDVKGRLIDFKIIFANDCNRDYLNLEPGKIVGQPISKVFPFLLLNGELEQMIKGFEKEETVSFERQVILAGNKFWFHSIIKPMDKGILEVTRNKTDENEAHEKVLILNEELKGQNKELVRTEAFLDNIIKSTNNIVVHYGPIKNREGQVIDFRFLYANDVVEYVTGDTQNDLLGQSVLEKYPMVADNGLFDLMLECLATDDIKIHLACYNFQNRDVWLQSTLVKLGDGITNTARDVTEQVIADKSLRLKNVELKRINEELESFNRVASHDLQEPLRKIQMFISRLEDTEKNTLTKRGLEYFDKVKNGAIRMQLLIRNLLTYSRIASTIEDFREVDLNMVLEKVMDELAESINDSKAQIVSERLPKVQGVFFQTEQLFSNLIANAIKYRNPKVAPKILIHAEKVHGKQIPEDFIKSYSHYYKITMVDNGIGFEDGNANLIFELFQRLHQRTEYSGTGIGLAICKKIVENHQGFIYATSKLGKGSAFIIYLPAQSRSRSTP